MIDVTFDFRSDTPPGKDPDTFSPTLRRYHQLLWSKPLPSGELFELDVVGPPYYLHHRSELGEFLLSSDAVVPSFSWLAPMIDQIPEAERDTFNRISYTIGGMMVFPAQRVDGKMTINGARGLHPRIKDRFDLTVECIRRHYLDEPSPLSDTLARYADFFGLFEDFAGYVDFFHLQDLVEDASTVRFFMPFADFTASPLPATVDAYLGYRQHAVEFIRSRNRRIAAAGPRAARPIDRSVKRANRDRQRTAPAGGVRADPTVAASFKTAKARPGPSKPATELTPFIERVLAESPPRLPIRGVLDYGCGRGADLNYFRSLGIDAEGYDPHAPFGFAERPAGPFIVVTLIYVLNVLPTAEARKEVMREAAARLAPKGVLFVGTRSTAAIRSEAARNGWRALEDGFVSGRGTFQRGMDAEEIIRLGAMLGLKSHWPLPPIRDASLVALARRTPTTGNA